MIWLALMLLLAGLGLTLICALRKSRQVWLAALGTLLAGFAVLGAASIGMYFIPVAAIPLIIAAVNLRGDRILPDRR
jgi:hypothetical protein